MKGVGYVTAEAAAGPGGGTGTSKIVENRCLQQHLGKNGGQPMPRLSRPGAGPETRRRLASRRGWNWKK